MKTYNLELVLVESTDDKSHEIGRRELGRFPTEEEARVAMELIELADPDHIIRV